MAQIKQKITGAILFENDCLDLRNANLYNADLSNANLHNADLRNADLHHANLSNANLYDANLSNANLRNANLYNANLHHANLSNADLRNAKGYLCLGTDPRGYHFRAVLWTDGWRIDAGCRWFTIAEAVAHWANNKDALARVAIVAAHT